MSEQCETLRVDLRLFHLYINATTSNSYVSDNKKWSLDKASPSELSQGMCYEIIPSYLL